MKELIQIRDWKTAKTMMNPLRISLVNLLTEPKTCAELSCALGISQQRVNNNIQELVRSGVVVRLKSRRKKNMLEGLYQAAGRVIWFSPRISRAEPLRETREQRSLHNLLLMSEKLQEDASHLLDISEAESVPSIGITAEILLNSEREREVFSKELIKALHEVLERYQGSGSEAQRYTAMIVCYPKTMYQDDVNYQDNMNHQDDLSKNHYEGRG